MERDKIEKYGNSVLQHGTYNNRIYLMKYDEEDFPGVLDRMEQLVKEHNYSKIFAKVPSRVLSVFIRHQWQMEAYIPSYFTDGSDAVFVSRFFDEKRRAVESEALKVMDKLLASLSGNANPGKKDFHFRELGIADAGEIANIYRKVFESYPFPIHDPEYIAGTMKENFRYFGVFSPGGRLAGVSSSEMDTANEAVEMTDFAVDPEFRGNKLALVLLGEMEKAMTEEGMKTFFTIARLHSPAMNKTFLNLGYKYSGTLVRNTNICGRIESMNLLYKKPV